MARKCGRCRQEGHTVKTCTEASDVQHRAEVPTTRTCACGEITTMGAFPGRHEAEQCGENATDKWPVPDPFSSPTKAEKDDGPGPWFPAGFDSECATCDGAIFEGDEIRADGSGGYECENCGHEDAHPEETPVGDHRKWCTRCKLLGHYSADCTTAVLSGGVVSVPVSPNQATVNGMVTVPVVTLPPEEAGGECGCGRGTSNDNEVCDTCAEPAPATHTGRPAQHTSPYVAALAAEVGDVGTATLPAQEYHPGAEPKPYCEQCDTDRHLCKGCGEPVSHGTAACLACSTPPAEPDPFTTPTQPVPEVNVSGQPAARYEWYGKQNRGYLVKLPDTGDFRRYKNGKPKGLTRATTFNKAATDQNALADWKARNVLIGASKRPDLVAKAHGLTHEDNRDQLMKLVAELETTAGAKVSADVGTLIHELTERWDAGVVKPGDIPAQYGDLIYLYDKTLKAAGLWPVPGLIERTTYIPQFGGVVGTLDRVYYHEASGQYVIGDVKTGKTLKYGMDEIETQEWIYAHGVNNAGVYDWNTDTWCPPGSYGDSVETGPWQVPEVSEDWGVVVHMPVQGDDAGKVMLVRADLQRGRQHAEVCHDVRVQRANKPKPEPWTGEELKAPETATETATETAAEPGKVARGWDDVFSGIDSREEAAIVWQKAYDAGVPPEEMARLKELADARLAELAGLPEPVGPMTPELWEQCFSSVESVKEAGAVWEEARKAGVEPLELGRLVGLAQQRLRELGIAG